MIMLQIALGQIFTRLYFHPHLLCFLLIIWSIDGLRDIDPTKPIIEAFTRTASVAEQLGPWAAHWVCVCSCARAYLAVGVVLAQTTCTQS